MAESSLGQIYTESKKEVDALDARLLIQSVLNITATDFISRPDIQILPSDLELIHRLIHRRKSGEPVSKILGQGAFWSRDFIVTPDVLDPRPDTELLIEVALDGKVPETILDIGTLPTIIWRDLRRAICRQGLTDV
jgi:release factor glutamine methyltransferase